ncbi:MAG: glycoside hydrolase family 3 C-terminal domain-containing protein [Eubacteriales bacterium]|nr:glycoside hydrolase family 3 C-terminal domain-containing protein [Eubacteriales bacterium]
MKKWARAKYQLNLPLGEKQTKVTASPEHLALAREAGREGMVLLKNENKVLPVKQEAEIALFGKGVFDYVKGGGGSGDVTVSHIRNLYDGLTMRENPAKIFEPLAEFYRENVEKQYREGAVPGMAVEPEIPAQLLCEAKKSADTALIVISRFSGEGWDRKSVPYEGQIPSETRQAELSSRIFENSDYYLTAREKQMVDTVCENFEKVAVVLNVGGMVDTTWFAENAKISSVLMAWQGGMEGGLAMADVLLGEVSPSGKLADTFAGSLEDYPSTENFHESADYVDYTEDIYVGYRYFETMEGAKSRVNYPFGFGLSYTDFQIQTLWAGEKDGLISIGVQVKNAGDFAGKEVVQVYYSAPQGLLGKPAKVLGAFEKTKELKPGETQVMTLTLPVSSMASYDDLGKVAKSAYILEKGVYRFFVGNSVRDTEMLDYVWETEENLVTEQLQEKAAPARLKQRLLADGSYEELPLRTPNDYMENGLGWSDAETEGITPAVRHQARYELWPVDPVDKITLEDVAMGKSSLEEFMQQLSDEDLAELLGGQPNTGVANTFGFGNLPEYGVPNLMTADGPAGLRIASECGIYTTAWPCATLLASTWNRDIVEAVGRAGAEEVKENNISVWLTPAVNIHRSPLCGRNFEYYSEDPFLTGELAAAMVKGIQSQGIAATVKHFACNNKETNRKNSDSRVSERALREIYLKAFEIIVKKSQPWALMTSYNLINGHRASENKELLEDILRGEWGYQGVITTDWWTKGEHYKELKAGNDIKMGTGYPERVMMALEKGLITREDLEKCAKRVLEMILKVD